MSLINEGLVDAWEVSPTYQNHGQDENLGSVRVNPLRSHVTTSHMKLLRRSLGSTKHIESPRKLPDIRHGRYSLQGFVGTV